MELTDLALDAVTDARDTSSLLLHVLHKLVGVQLGVAGPLELAGRIIDGPSKTWPDGQQAADQAGHQVLARP